MDELKKVLALVLDLASQMIDELDDETMTALTELILVATQKLAQQQPQQPPTGTPELQPAQHQSAQIHSFKYDDKTGRLLVKFQGDYPQQNGPVYSYDKVPSYIFDVFRRGAVGPKTTGRNAWHAWKEGVTPSLGAAMNALIKAGGFPYRRIS